MEKSLEAELLDAVSLDAETWNQRIVAPRFKDEYESKLKKMNQIAFRATNDLVKVGYIDRNKGYKG